jgi:hypothetical protein
MILIKDYSSKPNYVMLFGLMFVLVFSASCFPLETAISKNELPKSELDITIYLPMTTSAWLPSASASARVSRPIQQTWTRSTSLPLVALWVHTRRKFKKINFVFLK